jgi:hypothetical protein
VKPQWSLAACLTVAALAGCERVDTLSVTENPSGQGVLQDMLVGQSTRVMCVTASIRERCSRSSAQVIVENLHNLNDVQARWSGPNVVRILVASGNLRQMSERGGDGSIRFELT